MAAGRSFVATPSPGQSARALQARLLDQPDIVDAVPDGGRVRFVRDSPVDQASVAPRAPLFDALHELKIDPVPPRFEDGFMMLLKSHSEPESTQSIAIAHPLARHEEEAVVRVQQLVKKFGTFTAVDHIGFEVRRGEIFGLLGPEWRRQDHDVSHAVRLARTERRRAACGGRRRARCARLGPGPTRIRRTEVLALWSVERDREPGILRQRIRIARRAQARAHRLGNGAIRARRARARHQRAIAGRIQAAPRHGGRAAARAGNSVSR